MTLETAYEMEYLNWVIMETLRMQSAGTNTSYFEFTHDTIIGNMKVRKGDEFMISLNALHYNGNEWQRPHEFIPERFDSSNPVSLTPTGQKRNPTSWAPFAGGKRVCFGKTFAETNLKFVAIYLSQHFNFEFVDKKYETMLPTAHLG